MLSLGKVVAAFVLAAGVGVSADAAVLYTVQNLGVPDGYSRSRAADINNRGQVVGITWTGSSQNGFLYENGVISVVTVEGRVTSQVAAINNNGVMTGMVGEGRWPYRSFGFVKGDGFETTFEPLGAGTAITPYDINDAGDVVGNSPTDGYAAPRGFYRNGTTGEIINLGTLNDALGNAASSAAGINSSGQITGSSIIANFPFYRPAYLYENGTMTEIGMVAGHDNANAHAINDAGVVVGESGTSVAFKYENGQMISLGAINGRTAALDINNDGVIVGVSGSTSPNPIAFVYRDGEMLDLNTLIPQDSGWVLQNANGINDLGQIVGWGLYNGEERAFLLTPVVPEPGTAMLAAVPAMALLRRRR